MRFAVIDFICIISQILIFTKAQITYYQVWESVSVVWACPKPAFKIKQSLSVEIEILNNYEAGTIFICIL